MMCQFQPLTFCEVPNMPKSLRSVHFDLLSWFGKTFKLLLRGSRDRFKAVQFHNRYDRGANTLAVILDTKDNIFDGFTSIRWEAQRSKSSRGGCKDDESLRSFHRTMLTMCLPGRYCCHLEGSESIVNDCNARTHNSREDFGHQQHKIERFNGRSKQSCIRPRRISHSTQMSLGLAKTLDPIGVHPGV
jgi:hypothetical protein